MLAMNLTTRAAGFWIVTSSIRQGLALASATPGARPEDEVPPRGAHAEATFVILEVMTEMQLTQASAGPPLRLPVMEDEVEGVVDDVAEVEAGGDTPRERRPEHDHEQAEKQHCEWDRERGRQDKTARVVRMVVVNAVDHPVQPLANTLFGL